MTCWTLIQELDCMVARHDLYILRLSVNGLLFSPDPAVSIHGHRQRPCGNRLDYTSNLRKSQALISCLLWQACSPHIRNALRRRIARAHPRPCKSSRDSLDGIMTSKLYTQPAPLSLVMLNGDAEDNCWTSFACETL